MAEFQPIADIDRTRVRDAHDQFRAPRLWEAFPRVKVHAPDTARRIQGYRLDDLRDGVLNAALPSWKAGEQRPPARRPGEKTVTITETLGFSTEPVGQRADKSFESRFAYYQQKAPHHLDEVHRQMDVIVASYLINGTYFTTKAYTGAGVLDAMAATTIPDRDYNKALRGAGLRAYATQMADMKLLCCMDAEVARILSGYVVYSGRGVASLKPTFQEMSSFKTAFEEVHGCELFIYDAVYESARRGTTSSRANIMSGALWFGLVDSRMTFDLTTGDDAEGPDGALAIAVAEEPTVTTWGPEGGDKFEYFAADADMQILTPRYTSDSATFGIFYPTAVNFT